MPVLKVKLTEMIAVPEGTEIVSARTGNISGIRLPDGTFLKPWTTWEKFAPGEEDGDPVGDVTMDELLQLEVTPDIDFEREIEPAIKAFQ